MKLRQRQIFNSRNGYICLPEEVRDVGFLEVLEELVVLLRCRGVHPHREDVGRVKLLVQTLEYQHK